MKIVVLGSGGREHALVWKLRQSPVVREMWCLPGNGGIAQCAECVPLQPTDAEAVYAFVRSRAADLVVIGPEQPLVAGVADFLREHGVPVFGPIRAQARLEGSKVFAKEFMQRHGMPTAEFRAASSPAEGMDAVRDMARRFSEGLVVKADGLAAGKGVVVCDDEAQAADAVAAMMQRRSFGVAGDRVLVERRLSGVEMSVIAFCDGKSIVPLTHSQDHKRAFDGDAGPNTGGMGAFSPVPFVSARLEHRIRAEVLDRFVQGVRSDGIGYTGVMYFGLMIVDAGTERERPYVLEFNCRFGDPETQAILPLLETDFCDVVQATLGGTLGRMHLSFRKGSAVCVVLASQGYPGAYDTGCVVTGLEEAARVEDVTVFHAGTALRDGRIVTAGGRVFGVTGMADSLQTAIDRAYRAAQMIRYENRMYRKDIGHKGLAAL